MNNVLSLLAQGLKLDTEDIGYTPGGAFRNDGQALQAILGQVYIWAGIVAVIVIIVAAFFFVTSRGDANQMKRSKDAIRGAVIGLVVVMTAFVITRFVLGGLQG